MFKLVSVQNSEVEINLSSLKNHKLWNNKLNSQNRKQTKKY